jgi:penicillin-binding protein 1A
VLRRRRSSETPGTPRRRIRKLRFSLLFILLALVCSVTFVFGLVTAIANEIPSLDPASAAKEERNGYIYAADGTILAVLRGDEARVIVGPDKISPIMKQAIVAVEDRRFWEHSGIDLRGILRAIWADVRNKEIVQGGSTITQQFVKNTYIKPERTVSRKLKEAALAWQLERRWSKDRILASYLNTIYFGNGAYGVEMAARVYFQKKASELTLPEAALLAGIPVNPAAYDPITNPTRARQRRETVLALMFGQGLITRAQFDAASRAALPSPDQVRLPGTRGPAQYFAEYVKQQLIPYYGSGKVFGGGLEVYTSIDLRLQTLANQAIHKWLTRPDGPQAALVAVDPRDGRVLAMIGGSSFAKEEFNLAVQGERQPGSSFKPFVLAAALSRGVAPQTTFESRPQVISLGDRLWAVHNYENAYLGSADLRTATIYSDNTIYAQLTSQLGPTNVVKMAHRLGIQSPLDGFLAIGLGVEAVNPLEMARAFSTFANGGARVDGSLFGNLPRAVLGVRDGKRLDTNDVVRRQMLDPNSTAILNSMLQDVVELGTGQRAQLGDRPAAGKTGTTENYGDAWFVGYTPQLAAAVWVGYPDRLQPMLHEFNGEAVAGGTYPALIWRTFMKSALATLGEGPRYFPTPSYGYAAPVQITLRDGQWMRDNGQCRDAWTLVFFAGQEPSKTANCKPNEVEVPSVVGAKVVDAESRLAGQPLQAEVIYRPAKPGERPGIVLEQDPAGGTLGSFETVRLVVARATQGTIPRVVGLTLDEARLKLADRALGGEVAAIADGEPGVVVSQRPQAGIAAAPNMTVRLVVGRSTE